MSNLPKHIKPSPLRIPGFKGRNLPKPIHFIDELFKANPQQPELLNVENVRLSAGYFSWNCQRSQYQSFMREIKKSEEFVAARCEVHQKELEEKQRKEDEEQGALDKPLRLPSFRDRDFTKIKYVWFVDKLESLNPDQIITREKADRELGRVLWRLLPKDRKAGAFGVTEGTLRKQLLEKEAGTYWARRRKMEEDDEAEDDDEDKKGGDSNK